MDSYAILAAMAGAFLLAGFVKGVIGLGLPTVAIGLLGLMMTPAQAAAILVVPSLVTNVWQAMAGGGVLRAGASGYGRCWPASASALLSARYGCRAATAARRRSGSAWRWCSMPGSA